MSFGFCVLGSGSRGNSSWLATKTCQVLIDAGFSPDELEDRLQHVGTSWGNLDAVIITHTHHDHLYRRCLQRMAEHHILLFCHRQHLRQLGGSRHLKHLKAKNLIRLYQSRRICQISPDICFWPMPLPHDCPPTFGFRIDIHDDVNVHSKLAYLADLGHATPALLKKIHDVDLLALEFNHDEDMERQSRRPWSLIARVLGPEGHLSNAQAAQLLEEVIVTGGNSGPQRLVQLHLSEKCNDRRLAFETAQQVVCRLRASTEIFTTHQQRVGSVHKIQGTQLLRFSPAESK